MPAHGQRPGETYEEWLDRVNQNNPALHPNQTTSGRSPNAQGNTQSDTTRLDAIIAEANRIDAQHFPYKYGGSHGQAKADDAGGYDCSSAVSRLLQVAGYDIPVLDTTRLPGVLKRGAGPRVTIWVDPDPGQDGHTFIVINGRAWGTSGQNPGGGPGWVSYAQIPYRSGFVAYTVPGGDSTLDEHADVPAAGNTNVPGGDSNNSAAKASAFAPFIALPSIFNTAESLMLQGKKSLMNDQPLLPFIQQLCASSLRSFQSMPNGNFYAWMPDYFGGLSKKTAYWEIDDIEIIDMELKLSDDALATHVYTVGDVSLFDAQVDIFDKIQSAGVMTIFDAFNTGFINLPNTKPVDRDAVQQPSNNGRQMHDSIPKDDTTLDPMVGKVKVLDFLAKYGARPFFQEEPMIRSPFFELFMAYQTFMMMWSRQFQTSVTFTFMPELYPGGIVAFPKHGIQCYIEEVSHECDYESGFLTYATLTAPAAIGLNGPTNVSEGMVRAFTLGNNLPTDTTISPSKSW